MANEYEDNVKDADGNPRTPVDLLKPETCPPALLKFYDDKQRDFVRMGLENGTIESEVRNVKISGEKSGTGFNELWPYVLYRAVKGPGMTALARGRAEVAKDISDEDLAKLEGNAKLKAIADKKDGACDYFNYGFSLTIMQPIRIMLASKVGGPDKEIEKQVKQVMRTGLFASEDLAKAFVVNQRKVNEASIRDSQEAVEATA